MNWDLTKGSVVKSMLLFAIPMILGDLLQQCYNIADTLIVGQFLGRDALAAVGSAFTLMTFLTSIILGLCILCRFSGRKKLAAKSKKRSPQQPRLVKGQLNHSFLCFTAEHLQHLHSSLPPLYPQMLIMANVQMKIFRKANTAAYG